MATRSRSATIAATEPSPSRPGRSTAAAWQTAAIEVKIRGAIHAVADATLRDEFAQPMTEPAIMTMIIMMKVSTVWSRMTGLEHDCKELPPRASECRRRLKDSEEDRQVARVY